MSHGAGFGPRYRLRCLTSRKIPRCTNPSPVPGPPDSVQKDTKPKGLPRRFFRLTSTIGGTMSTAATSFPERNAAEVADLVLAPEAAAPEVLARRVRQRRQMYVGQVVSYSLGAFVLL